MTEFTFFTDPPKQGGIKESDVEVPPEEKDFIYWIHIYAYFISFLLSVIVNVTFVVVLLRGRRKLLKIPFFILVMQISVANLLILLSESICTVPLFILENNMIRTYLKTGFYSFVSSFDIISNWLLQLATILIALHRFFIFLLPSGSRILTGKALFATLAVIWVAVIAVTLATVLQDCYYKTEYADEKLYQWKYYCGKSLQDGYYTMKTKFMFGLELFCSVALPVICFILYIAIFVKLILMRKDTGASTYGEKQLLYQALFIFVMFQIPNLYSLFVFTRTIQASTVFLTKRVTTLILLVAGSLAPLFVMGMSKEIREMLYCCKKKRVREMAVDLQRRVTVTGTHQSPRRTNRSTMRHSTQL